MRKKRKLIGRIDNACLGDALTEGGVYAIAEDGLFIDDVGCGLFETSYIWEVVKTKIPKQPSHEEETFHELESVGALRYNAGKPEMSYLLSAPSALAGLCEAYEFGAKKYSRDNWQKGLPRNEIVDSLLRHLVASQNGEVLDPESGVNHLNLLLWNAMALADEYNGKRKND